MLKEWKELDKPGEEELKLRLDAAKEKLARQQLLIKEQKIPVLVVMEGENHFCIGILQRFRRLESLYF